MVATVEPALRLRKPLERAIRDGHPWVYRDALEPASVPPGVVARVVDPRGAFVARGLTDAGPIALRVFTTRDEALGEALVAARVTRAGELRARVVPPDTDAYRLLHGEGDRLPGFVCDAYGPFAVLKTDGAGATAWRAVVLDALRPVFAARGIASLYLRAASGADPVIAGAPAFGPAAPAPLAVREHGMTLLVDLVQGQKTGLFLDQRESRRRVRRVAAGLRVLNLYAYTGGFSVAAGLGGAGVVTSVDAAAGAVALADQTWRVNGLDPARHRVHVADVPLFLAAQAHARERYDLIVADPPSFAPREDALPAALQSYRALHAACLGLLSPGGYYLAASCSSHVDRASFAATVLEGARRARRVVQCVEAWGASADHPCLGAFPEGDYLKVGLYRVE